MKSYPLFSEATKLADLVRVNCRLLYVLPRFGIGLGFKERTVEQACEEEGIPVQFFLLVCNIYTFDEYCPDERTLEQVPMAELLDFLSESHNAYREMQVPKLFASITELADKISERHGKILVEMCSKYKELLFTHLDNEERIEFPYLRALIRGESPASECRLKNTEGYDEELCVALKDIKNMITIYLSDNSVDSLRVYRAILIDLTIFDYDTDKHVLLEDILAARIERITDSSV